MLFQFIAGFLANRLEGIGEDAEVAKRPGADFGEEVDARVTPPFRWDRLEDFERLVTIFEESEFVIAIVDEGIRRDIAGGGADFDVIDKDTCAGRIAHDGHAAVDAASGKEHQE